MITPITDEKTWVETLADLPRWTPPLTETLVISPHPDDETLGCGGLIAWLRSRGVSVAVVAVTDGENAYATSSIERDELRMIRESEQAMALARLGVAETAIHRFRITDSGVTAQEAWLTELLMPLVSASTHVIAPWPRDFHPDHEACGRAAATVAAVNGAALSYYFFWTWHRGRPEVLEGLPLVSFSLGEKDREDKWEALMCHRSQLERDDDEPILPDYLLEPARRAYEVYLPS